MPQSKHSARFLLGGSSLLKAALLFVSLVATSEALAQDDQQEPPLRRRDSATVAAPGPAAAKLPAADPAAVVQAGRRGPVAGRWVHPAVGRRAPTKSRRRRRTRARPVRERIVRSRP